MANSGAPLLLLLLLLLLIASTTTQTLSLSSSITTNDLQLFDWITSSTTRSTCQGSLSDCLKYDRDEFEFDLDSESNRRILTTSNYISYGALNRNRVPCSRRGASYYNCHAGAQANPYRRGCSAITRCRSW